MLPVCAQVRCCPIATSSQPIGVSLSKGFVKKQIAPSPGACPRVLSEGTTDHYEQKRYPARLASQMGLQLQTAHVPHSDICNGAPAVVEIGGLKKSLC